MDTAFETEYTAIIKQDGPWWIGWVEEVPGVNCQEATLTLKEALEMNRQDARASAGSDFAEVKIADRALTRT